MADSSPGATRPSLTLVHSSSFGVNVFHILMGDLGHVCEAGVMCEVGDVCDVNVV